MNQGTYTFLFPEAINAFRDLLSVLPHPPHPNDKVFNINYTTLNPWLHSLCARLQLPDYNWYSLKHGGATWLATCGWSIRQIMEHGRWKSESSARIYIHAPILPRSSLLNPLPSNNTSVNLH